MADLETLNIQISGTTKKATDSINFLIQKLSKLNGVLNSYSGSGAYMQGLKNLALGVTDLSKAVDNANVNRIKELASAMSTLATKGASLSKINASQFGGVARGLQSLKGLRITADQFAGVQVLSSSIGKLSGSNIDKASVAIPNLAQGLKQLTGIKIPNFGDSLYNLYSGLALLGRKSVVNAQGIGRIAEGLTQLNGINIDPAKVTSIADLGKSLAKLGYSSVKQAIENIPKLASSFTSLLASLSKAPQVSQETIRLAEAMAQLATASKGASTSTQGTSNGIYMLRGAIQAAMPTFKRAERRTFSLAAMFGKLYASYFLVIRAFRSLGSAINISSSLTEVENVVAATFGDMSSKLDEFAEKSMYDFGLAELSAKQYASRFQAMGGAMGITAQQVADSTDFLSQRLEGTKRVVKDVEDNYQSLGSTMADMSINLTKLVSDYASFFNMDYDDVAKDFESIFTGQTRPMRAYGIDLTNATLKEWAMKNGLDANIKTMTQAEKTMLRYQYVMAQSGKVMNDYQITMDNWANVLRTIKQQFVKFGSYIGSGFINIFKPVLIRFREFMNDFLKLTEKGLNAVGKLLGWEVEIEEVGVSMDDGLDDYVEDLEDAAGAAKKLNSQLRGIDELNNLTTNKGKGSGSGDDEIGAAGGVSGGGISFEKKPSVFESAINSWQELGNAIRDKILSGFKSISWDDLSSKVKLNAQGFVDFFKGLLMTDEDGKTLGGEMGRFLVEAINLGFDWLVTATGDKQLWAEIGVNIGQFFVEAVDNFDAKDAADTIDNLASGLFTMISTALTYMGTAENRNKALAKIGEFLTSLNWETYLLIISGIGFSILTGTVKSVSNWALSQGLPSLASRLIGDKLTQKLSGDPPSAEVGEVKVKAKSNMNMTGADALAYMVGAYIGAEIGRNIVSVLVYGEEGYFEWSDLALSLHDYFADPELKGGYVDNWKFFGQNAATFFTKGWDATFTEWVARQRDTDSIWWTFFGSEKLSREIDLYYKTVSNEEFELIGDETDIGKGILDKVGNALAEESQDYHSGGGAGHSFEVGQNLVKGIEEGAVEEANSSNAKSKWEEIKELIIKSLKIAFGIHSPATTAYPIGENIILGIFEGFNLVNFSAKMTEWWNKNVAPWFTAEKWSKLGEGIKQGLSLKWNEFSSWWSNTALVKWWNENVMPWFTETKWMALADNMKRGISNKWNEFSDWWGNTALVQWWNNKVKPWFTLKKWQDVFSPIYDAMSGIWDNIKNLFNEGFTVKTPHFTWDTSDALTLPDGVKKALETIGLPTSIPKLKVDWYAQGGFPTTGSLFYAGEAGAELLGSVNGKTTVASNGEITGISDTIRQTSSEEIALLRQQNALLQGILQKEFGISKDKIFKSVRSSAREYILTTGNPAFA